jgi:hypothetical protein
MTKQTVKLTMELTIEVEADNEEEALRKFESVPLAHYVADEDVIYDQQVIGYEVVEPASV